MWRALANGTLQSVGSDHAPFNFAGQKELGRSDFTKIPSGVPGIEERLMILYQGVNQGHLTVNRRNLALYLEQEAKIGNAFIQPGLANSIREARDNIQRIKQILRGWNVRTADHPGDES